MSDDNIHVLSTATAKDTALAAGLKIAEFVKRDDVRHIMAMITIERPDGRVGVVPISSAAGPMDACLMNATSNAIVNYLMTSGMINAEKVDPDGET
jgi:hypothetical protein